MQTTSMQTTVPPNGGNGNGGKPKLVITWHKGNASARIAYGRKVDSGWDWRTLSAVRAPGLIDILKFYADGFDNGE